MQSAAAACICNLAANLNSKEIIATSGALQVGAGSAVRARHGGSGMKGARPAAGARGGVAERESGRRRAGRRGPLVSVCGQRRQ